MVTCTYIINNPERVKGLRLENIMAKVGGRLHRGRSFSGADVHRVQKYDWSTQNWASVFFFFFLDKTSFTIRRGEIPSSSHSDYRH